MRFDLSDKDCALRKPLRPKSRKSALVDVVTAYNHLKCWSRGGIWKRVFDQLVLSHFSRSSTSKTPVGLASPQLRFIKPSGIRNAADF
jgi:hypothetical protein